MTSPNQRRTQRQHTTSSITRLEHQPIQYETAPPANNLELLTYLIHSNPFAISTPKRVDRHARATSTTSTGTTRKDTPLKLPEDFHDLLLILEKHQVEYMMIGGYAAASYGHVRYTKDIDLWTNPNRENANRCLAALEEFGWPEGKLPITAWKLSKPGYLFQTGTPPLSIDLLTGITGMKFNDCYARARSIEMDGIQVWIIGLEDLITAKKLAGRLQDQADVEVLEEILRQSKD
jgi:predicted nucleotidyltransferase